MKAKQLFRSSVIALTALLTAATFTACGDDDDDEPNPGKNPLKSATMQTVAYFSADMIHALDITGTYTTKDGQTGRAAISPIPVEVSTTSGKLTLYPMTATATSTTFPAELDLDITYSAKQGITLPATIEIIYSAEASATLTYQDGTVKNAKKSSTLAIFTIESARMPELITRLNDHYDDVEIEVDRNGVTDVSFN